MNIGMSTFVMQGGRTGVSTYITELVRQLQAEDTENRYDILAARRDSDYFPLANPNFTKRLYPDFLLQPVANLAWHNLGLPQKRYDILHIPSYRRIPLAKRTRIVATVHDMAAFAVPGKYDRARMFFNHQVVPSMIRTADHVITVSHSTKRDLVHYAEYPEEKISVVYPGIDHRIFRPLPKYDAQVHLSRLYGITRPFFVYVSRLEHPAKNHIRLMEAFERFKLENDSAHKLVLVGADWHRAETIRARAAESPVRGDIRFAGFIATASLPLFYNVCDLMVYPSQYEGFGLPIIEALACGAKVVCSNTSSMKEIADDVVPTFNPTDPEEIYQAMERAVSEGKDNESVQRGTEYAQRFNWGETARKTMEIYGSVA